MNPAVTLPGKYSADQEDDSLSAGKDSDDVGAPADLRFGLSVGLFSHPLVHATFGV